MRLQTKRSELGLVQSPESANEHGPSHSGESHLEYISLTPFPNPKCDIEDYPNTVSRVWFKMDDMKSIATFNQKFVSNINKMMNEYHFIGWKKSRGDGNCYYRAVIHGFLNELLMPFSKYDQHFYDFIAAIWKMDFAWVDLAHYKSHAIEIISRWYTLRQKGQPIEAFTEFLQQSENSEVDKILVMTSKMLTANYLIQNQENESIAPYLFEGLDNIIPEILQEGKEAGEIALLVLPLALGIQVVQYNFFEDIKVFEFPHEPENAAFVVPIISKRGGHYDILCNKQFVEDVQYNFEEHMYHFPNTLA
uniref:ubiquitinyl hydrolase 1 n=2 Tax=Fabrea salina TaxID=342563 RepID=A0A7S3I8P3_9CILI|mmetsp:Transcript_1201/g.1924  ORF Transcript_1201/g.1924 Transcript_1201/m.1924 type:complete len:306 (+) Transcript_1201:258-1175(+)